MPSAVPHLGTLLAKYAESANAVPAVEAALYPSPPVKYVKYMI